MPGAGARTGQRQSAVEALRASGSRPQQQARTPAAMATRATIPPSLDVLSRDQAVALARRVLEDSSGQHMEIDRLRRRVAELEREVELSQAREADLATVIATWNQREGR